MEIKDNKSFSPFKNFLTHQVDDLCNSSTNFALEGEVWSLQFSVRSSTCGCWHIAAPFRPLKILRYLVILHTI